jgi:hypothetical protein
VRVLYLSERPMMIKNVFREMESAKGVSKNKNLQERCLSFALMSLVDFLISISFEVSQPKEEKVMTNNN